MSVTLQPTFSIGTHARLFEAPVQPWYTNATDRSQVAPDGTRFRLLVPDGKTSGTRRSMSSSTGRRY